MFLGRGIVGLRILFAMTLEEAVPDTLSGSRVRRACIGMILIRMVIGMLEQFLVIRPGNSDRQSLRQRIDLIGDKDLI